MLKRLALTVLLGSALLPLAHRREVGRKPSGTVLPSPFEARADDSEGGRSEGGNCGFKGSYGLTLQGKVPTGGDVTGVGLVVVDGKGNLSGTATGTASSWTPLTIQSPVTGTYHLASDCTGTFSLTFSKPATITLQGVGVLVDDGDELHTIITSPPGFQLTGTGRKQ